MRPTESDYLVALDLPAEERSAWLALLRAEDEGATLAREPVARAPVAREPVAGARYRAPRPVVRPGTRRAWLTGAGLAALSVSLATPAVAAGDPATPPAPVYRPVADDTVVPADAVSPVPEDVARAPVAPVPVATTEGGDPSASTDSSESSVTDTELSDTPAANSASDPNAGAPGYVQAEDGSWVPESYYTGGS